MAQDPFKVKAAGGSIKVVQVIQRGPRGPAGPPGNSPEYPVLYALAGQRVLVINENNMAYYADCDTPEHALGIIGISPIATTDFTMPVMHGLVTLVGWGLTPNKTHFVGNSGVITDSLPPTAKFIKPVGVAITPDTLRVSLEPAIMLI